MKRCMGLKVVFVFVMCLLYGCQDDSAAPPEYGGINGIVTDAASGEPVSGVNLTVSPGGFSKVSGSDGRYEFQNLQPQQYEVQAQKAGYKYNNKSANVVAGQFMKCDIPIEVKP